MSRGYITENGQKVAVPGKLFYRGIEIRDIIAGFQAEGRFGFEEVCYLLLFGQLPQREELEEFKGCRIEQVPAGRFY